MTVYKHAQGEVNPATATEVDPQPKSKGIDSAAIKETGDGGAVEDGFPFTEWEYTILTAPQLDDLLGTFNLIDYKSYAGTFYTRRNRDRAFEPFYGVIHRPRFKSDSPYELGLWRGVVFKINKLEEI